MPSFQSAAYVVRNRYASAADCSCTFSCCRPGRKTRALHLDDGCHCKSRPINLPADKAPMYFKRGICSILSPRFGTEHMGSFLHQFWCTNNKFDAFKIRFKMYIPGHYERHIPVGATQGDKRCLGAALLWGRGENFPLKDAVACFFYGLMAIGLLKMTTCT